MATLISERWNYYIEDGKFVCVHIRTNCKLKVCALRYGAYKIEGGVTTTKGIKELKQVVIIFQRMFDWRHDYV